MTPIPGVVPAARGPARLAAGAKGRALISVSDKAGLVELAKGLSDLGYEVVSTGGSAAAVAAAGIPVTAVDKVTGFPEMLGGRVKTLHPGVHGGILFKRDDPEHVNAIKEAGIGPVDVVVANLYPFKATVTKSPPPSYAEAVENIDIGGPSMLRAAAKNHASVAVCVDPADYEALLTDLKASPDTNGTEALRRRLAWKAFQHCASYDAVVAEWMWGQVGEKGEPAPEVTIPMTLDSTLRYGENPHQPAAFYRDSSLAEAEGKGVGAAVQASHLGLSVALPHARRCTAPPSPDDEKP